MNKRPQEILEHDGERYMHATAIAKKLGIGRGLFYANIRDLLDPQQISGRRLTYYKVSQVEQKCNVTI